MPEMIADDYAAIARRMREIEDEKQGDKQVCLLCLGVGWDALSDTVCEACGNPEGRPRP